MNVKVSMIVAFDNEGAIGKNNELPWHLPADLAYVKEKTLGKTIVMGRKNYESIGRGLPGRRNIVMTRDRNFDPVGAEVAHTPIEVLNKCISDKEIFIFGGQQIYEIFKVAASKLYVTKIDGVFNGDTFFPITDFSDWKEVSKVEGVKDEKNIHNHCFHVYER